VWPRAASGRFGRHQSVADGEANQAWHVEDAEALHHLDAVALDGLDAQVQALGDLPDGAGEEVPDEIPVARIAELIDEVRPDTTLTFGPDGQTYAVIEDPKTREQLLYRPGDTVQKAAVKMVLRQKVVLNVDGRDEVLIMEEPGILRAAAPGSTAEAAPPPRLAAGPNEQVALTGEQVEKALEDVGDLLSQATFRPHIEDGRPAGISITGIKPNAIFRKLRLRNGDVITGVNSQSITSVDDAMKVFGTLSADGPIQVQVKRRGREETLEYKID